MNLQSSAVRDDASSEHEHLFSPIEIRGVQLQSRIVLSPMCQFSSIDGFASDWHLVHLGSRAVGGAALVFTESTAVTEQGRITPGDLGIWKDEHIEGLSRIASFVESRGAVPGIQLGHAGRKASRNAPWVQGGQPIPLEETGWPIVGPSAIPFDEEMARTPQEMTLGEIDELLDAFEAATRRAVRAGFKVIEVHAGHGYLLHEFLSPLSNHRSDEYGGSLENRCRLLLRIVARMRSVLPKSMPLFIRISATEWIPDETSWDLAQSVQLARWLGEFGVDVVDVSSGGNTLRQKITLEAEYQVPFARRIRHEARVRTAAVGLITQAQQADRVVTRGDADLVFIGRAFMRNPYWGIAAREELTGNPNWPNQYGSHALRRGMKKDN
ncbi:NADH:flavin oxidoreductase/NADH oxidase [Burkholderia sp. MR1-5-21]